MYRWNVDHRAPIFSLDGDVGSGHVAARGDMKALVTAHGLPTLIYALWRYLDDPVYEAQAFLVLSAARNSSIFCSSLTYRSKADPGNWPDWRGALLRGFKCDCATALGEPTNDWYPHKVLFDPATVLAESVDPTTRAAHVEAMRAALRDPALRVENPAAVNDIIELLWDLDAKDAAAEIAPYFLYSWKQAGTFRATPGSLDIGLDQLAVKGVCEVGVECLAIPFLAKVAGQSSGPLVLEQYAATTAADRVVAEGGGCAPLFFLNYAVSARFSRSGAVAAIDSFLQAHPSLPAQQAAALTELRGIVLSGQYQTGSRLFVLIPGWDPVPAP
jgi:hypothetical protein